MTRNRLELERPIRRSKISATLFLTHSLQVFVSEVRYTVTSSSLALGEKSLIRGKGHVPHHKTEIFLLPRVNKDG